MTRMSCPKERATRWRQRLAACAMIASLWSVAAPAAEYEFSEGPTTATWTGSEWHGGHAPPGVYCVRFPHPECACSTDNTSALAQKVTAFADELLTALQDCTVKIPVRTVESDDVR